MNPRVSRSSALASKATGFPIAKIAARLAVGYTLEEIPNDITKVTPASFEPTIDYVVVKCPRFAFEKFRGADPILSTHMKSVGEVMAIGRTFQQAFAKAMRSRELDSTPGRREPVAGRAADHARAAGRRPLRPHARGVPPRRDRRGRLRPLRRRPLVPARAARAGARPAGAVRRRALVQGRRHLRRRVRGRDAVLLLRLGVGPRRRGRRSPSRRKPSVVILGAGPNRIGQGIEFDYCCVHAAMTVRESGRDAVMVNCNPETVSTDYDTSDRLYFEPLTLEDVLAVCEVEQPEGVIVQFGGQTPLKLAAGLVEAGVPLLGTSVDAIDLAEDRGRFGGLLERLGYEAPPYAEAHSVDAGARGRARRRLPAARAPQLRARRPRDGDRLLRGRPARVPRAQRARRRPRDLPRPLPRGRDRGRRRRALRRRGGLDRRHHAARRGGRHPLGRQRLRAAAALARAGDARQDPRAGDGDRARASASSA